MDHSASDEIVFRPHAAGYLAAFGAILGSGAACLSLAARLHPAWLVGAALAVALAVALAGRYAGAALTLRGYELAFGSGFLTAREVSVPIWEARPEIRQTVLDRLLDTGTVVQVVDGRQLVARVARVRALRHLLAERRLLLIGAAVRSGPPAPWLLA